MLCCRCRAFGLGGAMWLLASIEYARFGPSVPIFGYVGGDYEARKGSGIGQGSISIHPGGHAHGPQPGAYERSIGAECFDELAAMVDTFRPLELGEGALACEDPGYAWTWERRGPTTTTTTTTGVNQ